MIMALLSERLGEWNPQLERELRSRFTGAHWAIAGVSSLGLQGVLLWIVRWGLPLGGDDAWGKAHYWNRYLCASHEAAAAIASWPLSPEVNYVLCPGSTSAEVIVPAINWPLWWLDLLMWVSVTGCGLLLLGSSLLLLHNLYRETRSGTLSLVRLSAQSGARVLLGKVLGVPVLVYGGVLLALPLQLWSAAHAGVAFAPILLFDLLAIAMTGAVQLLLAAIALGAIAPSGSRQHSPWLVELAWFVCPVGLATLLALEHLQYGNDLLHFGPLDAVKVLNPLYFLTYTVGQVPHSLETVGYLNVQDWMQLNWFGLPLWHSMAVAFGITLGTWGAIAACGWQSSLRRYQQPSAPLLSKCQSYGLTTALSLVLLGFAVQGVLDGDFFIGNSYTVLSCLVVWWLSLSLWLTPQRQTLIEWWRYRPQARRRSLVADLLWNDDAPASLAILLNLVIASLIAGPPLLIRLLQASPGLPAWSLTWFWGAGVSTALVWALGWELLRLVAGWPRLQWLAGLLVAPALPLGLLLWAAVQPVAMPIALGWVLLGEWLAIALFTWQLQAQLRRLGASAWGRALPPTGSTLRA